MKLYYDLHVHSCLSPCGDSDMTPNNIINMAKLIGLDAIAVSDHNSAKNLPALKKLAREKDILLIPAMELNSREEVHLLCLFYTFEGALEFSEYVHHFLPDIKNKPEVFGEQTIMDENDEKIGEEEKLLINALDLGIEDIVAEIKRYGGIVIPAHINKSAYSIMSVLGFIPPEYGFTCVEVNSPSYQCDFKGNVISNSDAHYLEKINDRVNYIDVPEKNIKGVLDYLSGKGIGG